jgi:hypothetical protein
MDFNRKWLLIGASIYFAIGVGSLVMALPNSGSTPPATTPPPAVEKAIMVIVFSMDKDGNIGTPAAAFATDANGALGQVKIFDNLAACQQAGTAMTAAAANPTNTINYVQCLNIHVTPRATEPPIKTNWLMCGNNNVCLDSSDNKLVAK